MSTTDKDEKKYKAAVGRSLATNPRCFPSVEALQNQKCDYVDLSGRLYYLRGYESASGVYMLWYLLPSETLLSDSKSRHIATVPSFPHPEAGDTLTLVPATTSGIPDTLIIATIKSQFHLPLRRVGTISASCSSRRTATDPPVPPDT